MTLRVEGKQNSLFPEGPVIKCFVKKNCEKLICTSGSQAELSYWNDTITVFFFAANKNKDNT